MTSGSTRWVVTAGSCRADDVAVLSAAEPPGSGLAQTFFARQQAGEVTFLVGRVDDVAVGSGVLHRPGRDDRRAQLTNLHVQAPYRGCGVGTAIVRAAETWAADGGAEVLVVGVDRDNHRARGLYERLGYRGTGVVTESTYTYLDDAGHEQTATEHDEDLVRRVGPNR